MTPPRTHQGGPPQRRSQGSSHAQRQQLLVFTEGERTEVQYLNSWHRRHRENVIVTISDEHGGPLTLVELAIKQREREEAEERRKRGRAHDEYWCVFDRDEHPHFEEAVRLGRKERIGLAVTNPCLELWFLWHFSECSTYIERGEAQDRAAIHLKCRKNLTDHALGLLGDDARYDDASTRARRMDVKHERDGSPAGCNPSSSMSALIDRIRLGTARAV